MAEETGELVTLERGTTKEVELHFELADEKGNSIPQYVSNGAFDILNPAIDLQFKQGNPVVVDYKPISDEPASKFILIAGDTGTAELFILVIRVSDGQVIGTFQQNFEVVEKVVVGEPVEAKNFKLELKN